MDRVTPSQIGVIALMVVFVISAILLIDSRTLWLPWVVAFCDRYFVVHFPTVEELADRRAAYVTSGGDELSTNEDDDPLFPAFPGNGNGAVPAQPVAGKSDGTSGFHFQSLEAANTYAETLLIERLAELVLAEKLDKSIAIKVGMRAATGRAYQAAKEKLEAAMVKQRYPTLTASRTKAISSIAK